MVSIKYGIVASALLVAVGHAQWWWEPSSFSVSQYQFYVNATGNSTPEQNYPYYTNGPFQVTIDDRLNCTTVNQWGPVSQCDAAPQAVYNMWSCGPDSWSNNDTFYWRMKDWYSQNVNMTTRWGWMGYPEWYGIVNLPYWGWESYNQSYYKVGFNTYSNNQTYIYYRTNDSAVVFAESRVISQNNNTNGTNGTYWGNDTNSTNGTTYSFINYFYGGLTYNNNSVNLKFENFLPRNACQWAYDKYPALRNDSNNTHPTTDDVIINAYVDNVLYTYGNGNSSLSIGQLTNWMSSVANLFNTSDSYQHAQSLAFQIMWLIDSDRDNTASRSELRKFFHGLTLTWNSSSQHASFLKKMFTKY
jgi:hypothetical protein